MESICALGQPPIEAAPSTPKRSGYRPMPPNFAETFERVGWDGICDACHANKRTVKRWLGEAGEAELQHRRRRYLEVVYKARGHLVPGAKPGRKINRADDRP